MSRNYRTLGARPVSISLSPSQIEVMDAKRGNFGRSEWIQTLINRAEHGIQPSAADMELKQLLAIIISNADHCDQLKDFIPRKILVDAIQHLRGGQE
jgi:predicted ATP-dependent Lon-type protease